MSIFPITPLVRQVQKVILQSFEVSEQDALDYAAEFVALAEGWGGAVNAEPSDFTYIIQKRLSESKYKWRSDAERETFEADQKLKHESYESEKMGDGARGRRNRAKLRSQAIRPIAGPPRQISNRVHDDSTLGDLVGDAEGKPREEKTSDPEGFR